MTHKSNHAERGYILVLTLLLVSIIVVSISQLVQRVSVTYFFDKTIVQREQAKELALSGIQLAISQLALKPEKKEEGLSSKIEEWINPWGDKESAVATRNVKEKIQNAQRRLKEEIRPLIVDVQCRKGNIEDNIFFPLINKIFKEEFGEKLIK